MRGNKKPLETDWMVKGTSTSPTAYNRPLVVIGQSKAIRINPGQLGNVVRQRTRVVCQALCW